MVLTSTACSLIAVFVLSILKGFFAVLHGRRNHLADLRLVNSAGDRKLTITTIFQIQVANEFGGAVYKDIGIVAGKNKLPILLCFMQLVGEFRDDSIIQIALWLINDQWPARLCNSSKW